MTAPKRPRRANASSTRAAAPSVGPTVYMICPIGASGSEQRIRSDEIRDFIVEPAAKFLNATVRRSDTDEGPGSITEAIVRAINECDVVVADLTGANPNVYYELGVAHSFGRSVVLMIDHSAELPFDVRHERVIELGSSGRVSLTDAKAARDALGSALSAVLADGYEAKSVVSDVANARSLRELETDDPLADTLAALGGKLEDVTGRLRRLESLNRGVGISGLPSAPLGSSGLILGGTVDPLKFNLGGAPSLFAPPATNPIVMSGTGSPAGSLGRAKVEDQT